MLHIYNPTATQTINENIVVSNATTYPSVNGTYIKTSLTVQSPASLSYIWTKDGQDSYPRIMRTDGETWILTINSQALNVYFTKILVDPQTNDYEIEYYNGDVPVGNWQYVEDSEDTLILIYNRTDSSSSSPDNLNKRPVLVKQYKKLYNEQYSEYGEENLSSDPTINNNKTFIQKDDGINTSKSVYINKIGQALKDNKFNIEEGKFENGYPQTVNYNLCDQKLSITYKLNKNQYSRNETDNDKRETTIINNTDHQSIVSCGSDLTPTPTTTPTVTPSRPIIARYKIPTGFSEDDCDYGTACPAGCIPEANWFCCPDNIYAAMTEADCPSFPFPVSPTRTPTATVTPTRTATLTPTVTSTPTPTVSSSNYICDENWKWPISVVPLGSTTSIPGSISGLTSGALWQGIQLINDPPRILKAGTTNGNFIIGETIEFITDNHPITMVLDNLQYTIINIIYNDPAFVGIDAIYLTCLDPLQVSQTPTPTSTQTPTPTVTATVTSTATLTPTPTTSIGASSTPTPTATATLTPTVTLTATATLTPTPTATPPIVLKTMFIAWTDY